MECYDMNCQNKKISILLITLILLSNIFCFSLQADFADQEYNKKILNNTKINQGSVICGYVRNLTETNISNVYVTIYENNSDILNPFNSTETNSSGYYSFKVPVGSYRIKAHKLNFIWVISDYFNITNESLYWKNITIIKDEEPPLVFELEKSKSFSHSNPGDISVSISDRHLQSFSMKLFDENGVTFNKNSGIWAYFDQARENKTYHFNGYNGSYIELVQGNYSIPSTRVFFSDLSEENSSYIMGEWKKNLNSDTGMVLLEFDSKTGNCTNVIMPLMMPNITLKYVEVTDLIEPSISTFQTSIYNFKEGWIENKTYNYSLYEIGNENNPKLCSKSLKDGSYNVWCIADDRAFNVNSNNTEVIISNFDNESPIIIDHSANTTTEGDIFLFNASVIDNFRVSEVFVEYWYDSQPHHNMSMRNSSIDFWNKTINIGNESDHLNYYISAVDYANNWNETNTTTVDIKRNHRPEKPSIDGETRGSPGIEYQYTFTAYDPDEDNLFYIIDWGDGSEYMEIGPLPSGSDFTASHEWNKKENYSLRARSKDEFGLKSDWETLEVSIPKWKIMIHSFLQRIFERFPNAFPKLRQLYNLK